MSDEKAQKMKPVIMASSSYKSIKPTQTFGPFTWASKTEMGN